MARWVYQIFTDLQPTVVWDAIRKRIILNFNDATIAENGDSFQVIRTT